MEYVRCLGKKFTIGYDTYVETLHKGQLTTNEWSADRILIVPTEDGYKLALKVYYEDNNIIKSEICEIKLDNNGKPYIDFGTGDFPYEKNYPIMVYSQGSELFEYHIEWDKCVFDFRDPDTRKKQGPNIHLYDLLVGKSQHDFFDTSSSDTYYNTICLNNAGLLLLMQFIQDPKNKDILDKKFTPPSLETIESFKDDIRLSLEKIMKKASKGYNRSEIGTLEDKLYILEDLFHRQLDTTKPILLNFPAYAASFAPTGNQFGE